MDKSELVCRIENFAPLDTAESWDCSGWAVETEKKEVNKVLLALTVTPKIVEQARYFDCDMIISHHPLFYVPLEFRDIDIYSAHTNLDLAHGGTTDTLISELESFGLLVKDLERREGDFVRYVKTDTTVEEFLRVLKYVSPNLRYTKVGDNEILEKIAFCAGSGSEFISTAAQNGSDAYVTGDLKFHTVLESPITIFDIGHFESEIGVLKVFEELIAGGCEVTYAHEESPFQVLE